MTDRVVIDEDGDFIIIPDGATHTWRRGDSYDVDRKEQCAMHMMLENAPVNITKNTVAFGECYQGRSEHRSKTLDWIRHVLDGRVLL